MRIAYVNTVAGYGSTGRLTDQLAGMNGIESRIYYGRKKNLSVHPVYRVTNTFGVIHHAVQTRMLDSHGLCSTKETYAMIEDLKVFQPDLIHLHNLHGYYLNYDVLFRFLKEINVPVVWTLHDCWAFTGHCVHYEAAECTQWKKECVRCPQLRTYYKTYCNRNVRRNYAEKKKSFTSLGRRLHLAVPSQWLKEQTAQSFLKEYRCTVIANGIDLDVFHPCESDFREKHGLYGKIVAVACSSVWTERKGLDLLVELSYNMPENCVLCVVGVSRKQIKMFSDNTLCIERTNNVRELAEIYSTADLFVNPTMEETFSLVNTEAQACGCPVATFQSGGSTEMISEKTGIIVKDRSSEGLLNAIRGVADHTLCFERKDCAEHASNFSLHKMFDGYMQLYQNALEGKV